MQKSVIMMCKELGTDMTRGQSNLVVKIDSRIMIANEHQYQTSTAEHGEVTNILISISKYSV